MIQPLFISIPEIIIILFFSSGFIVFPVLALIEISKSDFNKEKLRRNWIITVVIFGFIGAILYYTIGRKQKVDYTK